MRVVRERRAVTIVHSHRIDDAHCRVAIIIRRRIGRRSATSTSNLLALDRLAISLSYDQEFIAFLKRKFCRSSSVLLVRLLVADVQSIDLVGRRVPFVSTAELFDDFFLDIELLVKR